MKKKKREKNENKMKSGQPEIVNLPVDLIFISSY